METFSVVVIFIVLGGLKHETRVESAVVNVALQGLAFQSSTVPGQGEAHLAIDGNTDTDFLKGSCSQTTSEYQPWWTVDLRRGYLIANVTITSQLRSLTSQVPWAEIHVGESLQGYGVSNPSCSVITTMTAGATTTFPCNGMIGRYITLVIPYRIDTLTLCEVQVAVLNVPDLQIGLTIKTVSTSGPGLFPSTDTIIQKLIQQTKMTIRTLSRGTDNFLQRDNQTCVPMS